MRVDQVGFESYLETETLRNVRFYEKFGYNLVDTDFALGIEQYFMLRGAYAG